ncbi:MAG: RagB/SusD family nutrient uptake outer membrane protein [Paludibacteraceae bacterium]|nr:RagB/SusD family nutrient uptake outer membrane protein [Paludibacteraceae bacterium]
MKNIFSRKKKVESRKHFSLLSFSVAVFILLAAGGLSSCDSFLNQDIPQGTLSGEQVNDPLYIDNICISAYAIFISAEDVNSSFSMWNFDVRSDDAYKGGISENDGDVFHQLEISQGILTTNWNINDMWVRLYNCLGCVNAAINALNAMDDSYELKAQRLGEMRFLRAYAHFLLKRLYKNIPFVIKPDMTQEEYSQLSNTEYTNDEGWQIIADDLEYAYSVLPVTQAEKGRPTQASAAGLLAKVYLYKAYRQDDPNSHQVTEINRDDLQKVLTYTDEAIYAAGKYGLEDDFHNNFRPEPQYENGKESLWAMQYSTNDGTNLGNCNWSYGLMVPGIEGVTDGGCDFYKPSQNLVNAFRTNADGLPFINDFNSKDFDPATDAADPRLWLTVGIAGFPYEFNPKLMMSRTHNWSRSNGLYGYHVTLKHNVDPESGYLIRSALWFGTPMNRIVVRYADVLLMRAEALAQLGRNDEAIELVNRIRNRASRSLGMLAGYDTNYGAKIRVKPYMDNTDALARVKMERRLELAMESERFFDLVRWGEAEQVINKYYVEEANDCRIYTTAHFTANKNEYLPIPHEQIAASNGHYKQNIGGW